MFGWFKRKSSPTPAPAPTSAPAAAPPREGSGGGKPLLSFVMLESETFPMSALVQQLTIATCGGQRFKDVQIQDQIVSCTLGDEMCFISLMPAYPWSELEGPCSTAWMWPPDASPMSLKDHKGHLLITLAGGSGGLIARRLMLTAVTALIARQPSVMGIYWADATLVHYPPIFINMADAIDSPDTPPLYLWVDFRLFRNEDSTTGLFTCGLAALGHMEIEIPSIDMDPAELRDWALNISYYLLEKGPVLKDGDTIGISAEHMVKIRHQPSRFGHEGKVLCFGQ